MTDDTYYPQFVDEAGVVNAPAPEIDESAGFTANKAVLGVIIGAAGAGITAALGVLSSGNTVLILLTAASAALTALGVGLGVYNTVNTLKAEK